MSENGKHINYTSADIRKYLEGRLSAEEMHAIEKAAMDDPFLSDAIEGFQNLSSQQSITATNADIRELQQRLQERISGKKRSSLIFFTGWRAAAAVIVLLGISALTVNYILNRPMHKENIAQSQQIKRALDSIVANNNNIHADSTQFKKIDPENKAITEANKNNTLKDIVSAKASVQKKEEKHPAPVALQTEPVIREKEITEYKKESISLTKNNKAGFHIDSIQSAPTASADVNKTLTGKVAGVQVFSNPKKNNYKNIVQGKVVDANNQPVIGASVFIKNQKNATVTDNNGFFKLNSNTNNATVDVTVNSIGYQPSSATLSNNEFKENTIILQQSTTALNEVVVTGYGAAKKRDLVNTEDEEQDISSADSLPNKAIPLSGWDNFKKYIDQNKKINTADSTINGEEIFSFLIDSAGKISSFRIINSLSPAHDSEVIRLIKSGPKWQLLEGKKARIKLTINF